MKIGLTYDLKTDWILNDTDPLDANAEFDKPETVDLLERALRDNGHEVLRIGNARALLSRIDQLDVELVFNICEGVRGRNRESQVPLLCEMHDIPFAGADALCLGMTLDKSVAKKCFIADGLPTPRFALARSAEEIPSLDGLRFPLIVKACYEGTSKGLTESSRINTPQEAAVQVKHITRSYHQPAMIEEFIRGTEFTVAVLGNEPPQAMPVVQVSMDGGVELGDRFYTHEMVCSSALRYVCPARISEGLAGELQELAIRAYRSVGCRDLGRVDFRVDEQGRPYVLEVNPLPSFDKEDVFHLFPQVLGTTFEATIQRIIGHACERFSCFRSPETRERQQAAARI